ncbi:MAG: hypothetical protein K0R10_2206, partial [Alphaproteobacteria bacterium]|nr:hypothetical protein [Alphaproteobacteria bacterium]
MELFFPFAPEKLCGGRDEEGEERQRRRCDKRFHVTQTTLPLCNGDGGLMALQRRFCAKFVQEQKDTHPMGYR